MARDTKDIKLMKRLIEMLLKEQQMNLKLRSPRGYGWSHPYVEKMQKPGYGETSLPEDNLDNTKTSPVKISKAFKGSKK